ncbi:hypothetical protein EVAR_31752_1 [Eumeta japonica]|uniref:Uncharacterized protein n=1 Tax=Eumeta variegata TaxID=151549 RepID=A0A4C1W6X7_EUMVA|nr:hypothetical protein EVAR_31752_1 [Eumeta japonica]
MVGMCRVIFEVGRYPPTLLGGKHVDRTYILMSRKTRGRRAAWRGLGVAEPAAMPARRRCSGRACGVRSSSCRNCFRLSGYCGGAGRHRANCRNYTIKELKTGTAAPSAGPEEVTLDIVAGVVPEPACEVAQAGEGSRARLRRSRLPAPRPRWGHIHTHIDMDATRTLIHICTYS